MHLDEISRKAEEKANKLIRIMPRIGGGGSLRENCYIVLSCLCLCMQHLWNSPNGPTGGGGVQIIHERKSYDGRERGLREKSQWRDGRRDGMGQKKAHGPRG
ncbi:hypothetical protein WA026_005356 [Henosepilachna vigintioctopunctata]|uniref:Uncharacterized protein n=1 Tax=Henosepilachna vigintioctopunctata TaxID=420089 RepID=A0AAW1TSM8_9CUCU